MNKICTFTGHRDLPQDKINNIAFVLSQEIDNAIANGYTHFISGGAKGTDILAARFVTEKIDSDESITLSLCLPYKNFINDYDMAYFKPYCSEITYISSDYNISNYYKRNKKLVELAERIICIYDGRKRGGTYQTIKLAKERGIEIIIINPNNIPKNDV